MNQEQIIEYGRYLKDMTDTAGWKILEGKIKEKITDELGALKKIKIDKRSLQDIGAEYVQHIERIKGYEEVFNIIEDALVDKTNAENQQE